ncbi:fasciclin domain-containing protein [Rhodohalobacter sp. SW132]|uniref:fasciclin domain-containing protein n=1 Tax=Rhodohalobacter sp. SW132 TaxID=2293433 RepID=UPI000E26627B|nr:fasciclin domain-containing protein [Rhodohalobacter sp. SW132]REL37884.1 fasciclin domain-containing protein [Rhodohalobacter sp. SW132]
MKSMKKYFSVLSIFALIFTFALTTNSATAQDKTVVEVVEASENHTIFAELLNETNLGDAIADQGPYTIIAPTDQAFENLGDDLEQIRQDSDRLQNLVVGHLFQSEVEAADAGPALGIEITEGDIRASNGLVHITNEVIQ